MSLTEDKVESGFAELNVDGEQFLGVRVSGHKRSMAGQLQSLRRGSGSVVRDKSIEPWVIRGLIEHEGGIYAYGPHRPNRPLTSLFALEPDAALGQVGGLVASLETLAARSGSPPSFQPNLILQFDEGGLLFLPNELIDGILGAQTVRERVSAHDPYNHPDLSGERNACFFIGVMVYRILTGSLPYTAGSSEELHERIRETKVVPANLALPELRPELSELISRSFRADSEVTLREWSEELAECRRSGFTREISSEERARIAEAAQKFSRNSEAGFRRQVFFRKNWRTMLVVAGIVVIVGAVGGSILKNALKPRITVGMTPTQVVKLYYSSMDSFNSQAMQDCVIDGAGKNAISEATNLFVISRVRQGYEGTTGYVAAQTWLDEGKPMLKPGTSVYGVADLTVTKDSATEFTVNYEKWEPVQPDSQPAATSSGPVISQVQGWQRQDRLFLKNEGKFWAIYRIDHVTTKQLGGPLTVTNPALSTSPAVAPQTAQ